MLLAAPAYNFARRYAQDGRFTFGTGKLGDLAGFTSAIILAMIALLIGFEAAVRFLAPRPIHFAEAIPIACLGLGVNIASAWLLGGDHDHGHSHHGHDHSHGQDPTHRIDLGTGWADLEIHEDGVPPRFRLRPEPGVTQPAGLTIETVRLDGARQSFSMRSNGAYLESDEEVPEPHAFTAHVPLEPADDAAVRAVTFEEGDHRHGAAHRDNNMRAAVVHVMADAAVSVLVITGLLAARFFGWPWMDPWPAWSARASSPAGPGA